MDHATFQRELGQLKQRVAEMSAAYARRQSAFEYAKLRDEHLSATEGPFVNTASDPRCICLGAPAANAVSPSPICLAQAHQHFSLPSPPLFWSLFNALRTDVRSLDIRIGDLEHHVSDLEDRVDHGLDPRTPEASLANASDDSLSHNRFTAADLPQQAEIERPTRYAEIGSSVHMSTPIVADTAHPSGWIYPYPSQQGAPVHPANQSASGTAHHETTSQLGTNASPGVAFRDKEINDLEELVRSSQESLKRSEELSARNAIQVRELLNGNASLQRQVSHREAALTVCSNRLSAKQTQLEEAQANCHTKDAKLQIWASKHEALQQGYLQQQDELAALKMRLQQVYSMQVSRQQDTDELFSLKDDDLCRLRGLCESKHDVLVKQQEVIARGITLMQDKDHEIEQLRLELRALKDDFDSAARERDRYARLFEESGEVIAQLRASLSNALASDVPSSAADDTAEPPGVYMDTSSPFSRSGSGSHESPAMSWTPKPLKYGSLPDEKKRAEIWESGSITTPCTFGRAGWQNNLHSTAHGNSSRSVRDFAAEQKRKAEDKPGGRAQPRSSHDVLTTQTAGSIEALPPLPPRRLFSDESYYNSDEIGGRLAAKYGTMQDPSRRELQPYVEAEEEDGWIGSHGQPNT